MSGATPAASKLSVSASLAAIHTPWSPKLVASLNNTTDVKIAKFRGAFVWHRHPDTDELFYVLDGSINLGIREDGRERVVKLEKGELFVVPRGVEHLPSSDREASVLMIEAVGVVNTGDLEGSELTKEVEDIRK